jgi:2-keto-myo-inositol isomerase
LLSESLAPDSSLADDVRAASEAGFSALDLWAPKLDDALATYPVVWLDIELQKQGVHAASVSGVELPHPARQEDALVLRARFLELCTHLDALGGGTIVAWPGASPASVGRGTEAASWMAGVLRRYSNLAAPFEVRIALEPRANGHSVVRTLAAAQEVVQGVNRSNVGLALDIELLRESGAKPEDLQALDVSKLWLVRLEGGGLSPTTMQQAICKRLADKGYRGPYCIQWPAPAPADGHSKDAMVECARQARQAALEMLTPLYP